MYLIINFLFASYVNSISIKPQAFKLFIIYLQFENYLAAISFHSSCVDLINFRRIIEITTLHTFEKRDSFLARHNISVLIVDDHNFMQLYFKQLLASATNMHVISEAGFSEEAIKLVRELNPDVVLMELQMVRASKKCIKRFYDITFPVLFANPAPKFY